MEDPLKIRYSVTIYKLSPFSSKIFKYVFRSLYLSDDKGWIFTDKELSSKIGIDRIETDFYANDMKSDQVFFYRAFLYSSMVFPLSKEAFLYLVSLTPSSLKSNYSKQGNTNYPTR